MLDTLRAWLNGNREYFTGVILLEQLSGDNALMKLLRKGKTDFTYKRLQEELMNICLHLKKQEAPQQPSIKVPFIQPATETKPQNTELYAACIHEAGLLYKEMMNDRAVLFAGINSLSDFEAVNRPDLVQQRSKAAVDLVVKYQKVSQLYDRARYVKENGRLPENEAEETEDDYAALPDILVYQTLDKLRKNNSKQKKMEQTPERIARIQKHEENIKKLEARWQLLKPKK